MADQVSVENVLARRLTKGPHVGPLYRSNGIYIPGDSLNGIPHNSKEAMALELTDSNFETLALKSDKVVMVDFWAEWCGPCRMVGPVVEELAKEYDGKAVIGKVNVDNNPQVAMKYGIRSIPTILFLKNGEVVDRSVGAVPKSQLAGKLDGQLA